MITDVSDITSFKWATVVGVNPISIRLDGDTAPLALIPDSLVDPLTVEVGYRVRVELSLRKCVIHGVANGREPFTSNPVFHSVMHSTGSPLVPGGMLGAAEFNVTVTKTTSVRLQHSINLWFPEAVNGAGMVYATAGGVELQTRRYHSHARGLQWISVTYVAEFELYPGTTYIDMRVRADSGSGGIEIWDADTLLILT